MNPKQFEDYMRASGFGHLLHSEQQAGLNGVQNLTNVEMGDRAMQAGEDRAAQRANEQRVYDAETARIKQMNADGGILRDVGRQLAPGGAGIVQGVGRTIGGAGYIVGALDRLLGDGDNAFQDWATEQMSDADAFAQQVNRYSSAEGDGTLNAFQSTANAVGTTLPSLAVGYGLAAATGGTGAFTSYLMNPARIAYESVADAAGEAADVRNQLLVKGAEEAEANRMADYTAVANMALNVPTEIAGGAMGKLGGMLPGMAGSIGQVVGNALIEPIQEAGQDTINQTAGILNADGSPVGVGQYLANAYEQLSNSYTDNLAATGLPSFLSSALTGGAGAVMTATSPQAQQAKAVQEAARMSAQQPAMDTLRAETTNLDIPNNQLDEMATATRAAGRVIAENEAPGIPIVKGSVRQQARAWAETEIARITERPGEYDEAGNLTNPLGQEEVERVAQLTSAIKRQDWGAINQIRAESEPVVEQAPVEPEQGTPEGDAMAAAPTPEQELDYADDPTQQDAGEELLPADPDETGDWFNRRVDDAGNEISLGMAVGEKALGVSQYQLSRAKAMQKAGNSSANILKSTGWYVGDDGMLRTEIPDDIVNIIKRLPVDKPTGNLKVGTYKVGDIYGKNSKLVKMYPRLANLDLEIVNDPDARAMGSMGVNKLTLNAAYATDLKGAGGTLLHEIQHYVQSVEGFSRGGSSERLANLQKLNMSLPERAETGQLMELRERARKAGMGTEQFDKRIAAIRENDADLPAEYIYRQLAGEIEARETTDRAGKTKKELVADPRPDHPYAYLEGVGEPRNFQPIQGAPTTSTVKVKSSSRPLDTSAKEAPSDALAKLGNKPSREPMPPVGDLPNRADYADENAYMDAVDAVVGDVYVSHTPMLWETRKRIDEIKAQAPNRNRDKRLSAVQADYDNLAKYYHDAALSLREPPKSPSQSLAQQGNKPVRKPKVRVPSFAVADLAQMAAGPKAEVSSDFSDEGLNKAIEDSAVYKSVVSQLEFAGAEPEEVSVQAKLYAAGMHSFGKLTGTRPEEVWRNMGVRFTRQEGIRDKNGNELRGEFRAMPTAKGLEHVEIKFDPEKSWPNTFMHEQGHFWKALVKVSAKQYPDNRKLQEFSKAMDDFVGAEKDADWSYEQEEKLTDGFTNYFATEQAPSEGMRKVFEDFKAWIADWWALMSREQRTKFSPELKRFFDGLFAGDATFDAVYSADNPRVDNNYGNEIALGQPARSTNITKKGNVTTVDQTPDRSDTLTIQERIINSPNRIAQWYPKFKAYFDMGVTAVRQQNRDRKQYQHSIDKVFGKPGLFGRKGGLVTTEADRKALTELLLDGDAVGMDFTDAELASSGRPANVIEGYKRIRHIYKALGAKINAQRAKYGKPEFDLLEGYVPHIFHNWRVYDNEGKIVDSFKTMREAQKFAKQFSSDNDNMDVKVSPAVQDFSGSAKHDAVVLGDLQYFKFVQRVGDVFALNGEDARKFAGDSAKMASKSRFFGYAQHRKGYEGFSNDMEYAVRHYANVSARYMAMDDFKHNARRLFERMFGRFDRDYHGIASYTKNYINDILGVPTAWEDMENKMVEKSGLHKFIPQDYKDRPALWLGKTIRGNTAAMKLGFMSLGSAILNLSALNNVAAKTGYTRTSKAIAEYLANQIKPSTELRKLYESLNLADDITHQSASEYNTSRSARIALKKLSGGLFSVLDGSTRKMAAIAGYREGLKQGMTQRQAFDHAREVVDMTNFNYGVEDSSEGFRRGGQIGQTMLQFKKYPIKNLELGLSQLEGAEKVRFWGGALVMGGVMGAIPGFNLIAKMVKALFPEEELELEIKRVVAELPLPTPVKRALAYGAAANIGIDIGARVGMADMFPTEASDLLGPSVNTLLDLVTQLPKLGDGPEGALDIIQSLIPGIANPLKALNGETEDLRTGRSRYQYKNWGERAARAVGFRPMGEALEADSIRSNRNVETQLSSEQKAAVEAYLADRSTMNRDKLRELKVTVEQVMRYAKAAKLGTRSALEREQISNAKDPAARQRLTGFIEAYQ
jgi:hypothetical protein